MARARNIKPAFFTNEQLSECSPLARLLFIGLWTIADREGKMEDRPKRMKIELLPYDECDIDELLDELHDQKLIIRYKITGTGYIFIPKFLKHQNPHQKEVSKGFPYPEGYDIEESFN
jgi:hypothetical protein